MRNLSAEVIIHFKFDISKEVEVLGGFDYE